MTPLIIIAAYLVVLLAVGGTASRLFRGTSADYMLASHSIGPFLLLMSMFGTTMTAFALVGSTSEAFKEGVGVYGMLASSSGIIHSLCFFLIGVKVWSFGHKYGYRTQIQLFRNRLESNNIGLLLFPVLVGLIIPYLLIGVTSSGLAIEKVSAGAFESWGWFESSKFGLPQHLASFIVCCVVLVYVFFGGMRGTAWANTFQTIVFMVLGVVTFYVVANRLGKQDSLLESMRVASAAIPVEKLTRTHLSKLAFLTYMFVPLSVGMFPHLFQHWLTARSAATFKLSVVAHPIFIMIVWVPCVLIGVWATGDLVKIPPPIQVKATALLPFMVKSLTNPVLGGLLTAGILAAIMSSLDSQFLCIGSMFTNDIVVHYAAKDRFSDKQVVVIARAFVIAIVAVTYGLSLLEQPRVFTLGIWCFSGFASLFPLVVAAVYWPRLSKAGAYACIIAAISSWLLLFIQADYALNSKYLFLGMMPVATMIACSTVAMVVVSLVTRPPSQETLVKFFPDKR